MNGNKIIDYKKIDPYDEEDWEEQDQEQMYYLLKYLGDVVFLAQLAEYHRDGHIFIYLLKSNKTMGYMISISMLKPLTNEQINQFNLGTIEITPADGMSNKKKFKIDELNDIYDNIVPVDEDLYKKLKN